MSFSFRLLRAVRRHNSCWTMFNDHYSWTATRNADIVWVCMSAINRLFHKTPDNNRRLVQLFSIFLWIVGVRLCIILHFLQSDIIFGTIKACSEKALNRSCSKKHIALLTEKNVISWRSSTSMELRCFFVMLCCDIMSGILCLKWNARDCIIMLLAYKCSKKRT